MKLLALLVLVPALAAADTVDAVVRAQLADQVPAGHAIDAVHLPRAMATLDVDPAAVVVELPRALRAGRVSVKVSVPGASTAFVPVTVLAVSTVALARRAITAGETIGRGDVDLVERPASAAIASPDIVIGARASRTISRDAVIGTRDVVLPPPLARGTRVSIEVRRGAVTVRGSGVLELAARVGQPATARLAATKQVVHGTLVGSSTVVVGDAP